MPRFETAVNHALGREEAIRKLQGFSDKIRETYREQVTDVQENWSDEGTLEFSFVALGMEISGRAIINDEEVAVDGTLPFAASLFRGQIEKQIQEKLVESLEGA